MPPPNPEIVIIVRQRVLIRTPCNVATSSFQHLKTGHLTNQDTYQDTFFCPKGVLIRETTLYTLPDVHFHYPPSLLISFVSIPGHQLRSQSLSEMYVQTLLKGCRCLELDCWPTGGGESEDICITHGGTLCTKVSFKVSTVSLLGALS